MQGISTTFMVVQDYVIRTCFEFELVVVHGGLRSGGCSWQPTVYGGKQQYPLRFKSLTRTIIEALQAYLPNVTPIASR